jgi:ATP-dependent RNA helicase DDX19/DBP5
MEEHELEISSSDTSSIYRSSKTWDDLSLKPSLLRNLEKINWVTPTQIQAAGIDLITQGKNIAGQSKNGSGKTGTFVIGCLNRIDKDFGAVQAICISHSRELNQQNFAVFEKISEDTGIKIGISQKGDRAVPRCHILCGTHGTLVNLFRVNREQLAEVKMIIYDECDFLLTHPGTLENISTLRAAAPRSQQILFSATFTDQVWQFIQRNIPNPTLIRIQKTEDLTLDNVEQYLLEVSENEKAEVILEIIKRVSLKTCLIFLNRKIELDQLHAFLTSKGYKAHVFAADRIDEDVRDQIIEKVRRGEVKVLLCTNVLSRGVDLRHINIVINVDPPVGENRTVDPHTYLHRVGRTGRFGRRGLTVNIVSGPETRAMYLQIEKYFGKEFSRGTIDEIADSLERVNEDYAI